MESKRKAAQVSVLARALQLLRFSVNPELLYPLNPKPYTLNYMQPKPQNLLSTLNPKPCNC